MNRIQKFIFALLLFASLGSAHAQSLENYLSASEEFERLTSESATKGVAPRRSDPQVAKLLSVLADEKLLQVKSYGVADLNSLLDVCGKANAANMTYVLFGLKSLGTTVDPVQVQVLAGKNMLKYQDEIFPLSSFLNKCMATQLPLMAKFLEALPPGDNTDARKKGIRQFREGIFGLYASALSSIAQNAISERHRTNLLASLANTANVYATALPAERRQAIMQMAEASTQRAPQSLRGNLLRIAAAMKEAECATLCRM